MGKEITEEEFRRRIMEIINERNKNLASHFSARQYEKMPGEFTLKSRIVTHEGEVIPGKDSQRYWTKVGRDLQGTDLSFGEANLKVMPLEVSAEPEDDEIDFIGVELTEFSFKVGDTTHKGYIDPPYRHRVKCTIDD